jgi:hypothetical protein
MKDKSRGAPPPPLKFNIQDLWKRKLSPRVLKKLNKIEETLKDGKMEEGG